MIKVACLLWLLFMQQQEDIPFKPKDEFEVNLNFEFRQRPQADISKVEFNETQREHTRRSSTGPLPYLRLNLSVLKVGEGEFRLRVIKNTDTHATSARKLEQGMQVKLDLGYTDDIKDRISAYEYIAYFLSDDKKPLTRVVIYFDKDGTYYVNGEKRGRL